MAFDFLNTIYIKEITNIHPFFGKQNQNEQNVVTKFRVSYSEAFYIIAFL